MRRLSRSTYFSVGFGYFREVRFWQASSNRTVLPCRKWLRGTEMGKIPSRHEKFGGGLGAAGDLIVNRKRPHHFPPLVATVPVRFIELRSSMCRWPIGDPQHFETFRFCGSSCSSEASYCKAHTAIAHAPNRPAMPRARRV